MDLPGDLDGWLAAAEARFPDLRPGAERRILWAGRRGERTRVAVVYLHGFSATSAEIAPLPERVAAALGANLFLARFTGHGLTGDDLGRASLADWLRDAAEAVAVARRLGERVVVIGTSTGASLAILAALRGAAADGYVFVSPNFRLRHGAAFLLTWPLARLWAPWLAGRSRGLDVQNEEHRRLWTATFPTRALVPMARAARMAGRAEVAAIPAPLLAVFRNEDQIVDARITRRVLARWGGPVMVLSPEPVLGDDPRAHLIVGNVLSPGATGPVSEAVTSWIGKHFA